MKGDMTLDEAVTQFARLNAAVKQYKADRDLKHLQLCAALDVLERFLNHWDQAECREFARTFLENLNVDRRIA